VIGEKMRKEYATVKIPVELSEKLDVLAKDLGYRSRAEIVDDAIRRFLETKRFSGTAEPPKPGDFGRRKAEALLAQISR
jgi:Arc/MetJ-type ribon-helix-helix transcriptional regulator